MKSKEFESMTVWLETAVRLIAILGIIGWCLLILSPFLTIFLWALILTVAVYPVYAKVLVRFRGRKWLASTFIVVGFFLILFIPAFFLAESLVQGVVQLRDIYASGNWVIPAPDERVDSWPSYTQPLVDFWRLASENFQEAVAPFRKQLNAFAGWLLSVLAEAGIGLGQLIIAFLVSGGMLRYSDELKLLSAQLAKRLAGDRGEHFAELAQTTIRNVLKGILGVALTQSIMAGIGFLILGIPGAGLWTLFCLILATMQIGVGPILIPMVIYAFYAHSTSAAVFFLIWTIIILVSDNILKPILLGRGARVPMLVVFLGSIGGFLSGGLTGLFLGPVVLSIGYVLVQGWLEDPQPTEPTSP